MRRNDPLDSGCTVETRIREQHVYGETTDDWCIDHDTWHAAEHHEFGGRGEVCDVCQNARRWHVNGAPAVPGQPA
jgi:hypothetical protein